MPEDLKDLQRGLISAEPLMVIGNAVAGAGQDVQDAWEYVQSHLTGGKMPSMPSFSVPSFSMPASAQAAPAQAAKPSIDYDKLAAQHGGQPEVSVTMTSKPGEQPPSDIEFDQMAKQFGGAPEDPTGGAGQPVPVDDNSLPTFLKHFAAQVNPVPLGQLAPFPKSMGGAGWDAPAQAVKAFNTAAYAVKAKGDEAWKAGNYGTALRHYTDWLASDITLGGSLALDKASDDAMQGKWAAALGDTLGLSTAAMIIPKVLPAATAKAKTWINALKLENPNAAEAAAVKLGQAHGVSVDAGTATGNKAVQGAQFLADRSFGGSLLATGRAQQTANELQQFGGELAQRTGGKATTPEQGGATIGEVLAAKQKLHKGQANTFYDRFRSEEQLPTNQGDVPLAAAPVDNLDPNLAGQLRRMVHELDASGYTDYQLEVGKHGGTSMQHVEGTGGAGAKVFDDITQLSGTKLTRGALQGQLERYLAGGEETGNVKAAIEVAKERSRGRADGVSLSKPELPPSAMDIPTQLEKGRVRFETMGLPTNLEKAKAAFRPVVAQLERQLPATQAAANPALKAMRNIIDGPDWMPASQAERDLSTLKRMAREQGGLAKTAVAELEKAVQEAIANGTPEAKAALEAGRQATRAQYAVADVIERLTGKSEEPVAAFRKLTANGDSNINLLRAVRGQAPQALKEVARAYLEQLLSKATAEGGFDRAAGVKADWDRLGPQTKQILFPDGQAADIDKFLLLAKKIGYNPNPSGTGMINALRGSVVEAGAAGGLSYATGSPVPLILTTLHELGGPAVSALLHSKAGVKLLTNGLSLAVGKAPRAVQAAAAARILATAREMGLPVAQGASAGAPGRAGAESAGPDKTSVPPSSPSRKPSIQVGPYRVEPQ